jgi:Na+-translocating ferredoxin:NAD+ oxidoreductase RnfD subunit
MTDGQPVSTLAGPRGRIDPRLYQIACLAGLLTWGMLSLGFDQTPGRVCLLVATALVTQAVAGRLTGLPSFDPKSALISALSLCLLLRAADPWWLVVGAVLAVGCKFVFRVGGKHVFNPTNFGIVALLAAGAPVWVSPGQWGHAGTSAFLFACLGTLVVTRAARADVTLAFLAAWAAVLFGRAVWLGQSWAIPQHQMASGALLLFAFFMISDPKTTPNARAARVLFAVLVALGAGFVQFVLHRQNGLLWSLAAGSLFVPLMDRWMTGPRYAWRVAPGDRHVRDTKETVMKPSIARPAVAALAFLALSLALLLATRPAGAFCGFYVAQADAKLFNNSSQVAIARDGDRTVVTMANDYDGPVKEFAIVVPVPTVLEKDQVHIGDARLIERLDAFSAPRLVEYHDPPPCQSIANASSGEEVTVSAQRLSAMAPMALKSGVVVEARYTVGEYDILILSAKESSGLMTWLRDNGYRVPASANRVLGAYIRQGLKFFVAKVNLGEQKKLGVTKLRPIQIAYESPRFMLPIRLGIVNARGTQEIFVYTLTPRGRVEAVNYRTVKLPSDVEVPLFVKQEFPDFYRALFSEHVRKTGMNAVTLEYAWDASTCDPCPAPPLALEELRELGVSWLPAPPEPGMMSVRMRPSRVFVTRLHARYDAAHFPEDLVFQETANTENFQGRYVLRHPWKGETNCPEAARYRDELAARRAKQEANVIELTGWSKTRVRAHMAQGDDAYVPAVAAPEPEQKWWQKLWKRG